ncbi:MAG: aminotransferase class I/II-fold pyridoxal phosphate-dependent enzyme [Planctomycetota bacterium]|nr:MAG: aminotransferase class I/II-fold pyridoxal phosphate-dependent enzyme [Planctomycetota bacterium]
MQAPQIAQRLSPFGTTIFTEMTALANRHGAVNLSQGFPDDGGPARAHEAAARAMREGHNQYAPMPGVAALRRAISAWSAPGLGFEADPDTEITVTSGATEAIAATLIGLVNPGDEVVLFEPYFDSYRAAVAMAGATPRFVTLRPDESGTRFGFDPGELRAAFNGRTRMVLVNTPHNPTGMVFTEDELRLVAALCVEHDVIALSDEVYETLAFREERPHRSIGALPGMRERTVTISSIGKSFSLTGWKIGWAVACPALTAGVRSAHQFLTFAVAHPFQHAAAELLTEGRDDADAIAAQHDAMRRLLVPALAELGFGVYDPEGTYFVMADHRAVSERLGLTGDGSADVVLCRWLTEHAGVATIPPSVFYEHGHEGAPFLRFAFCKREATIREAIARLRKALG